MNNRANGVTFLPFNAKLLPQNAARKIGRQFSYPKAFGKEVQRHLTEMPDEEACPYRKLRPTDGWLRIGLCFSPWQT